MVIGRLTASRARTEPPSASRFSTPTSTLAKAGMYFDSGSLSASLPSSTSIIAATDVIGFDME